MHRSLLVVEVAEKAAFRRAIERRVTCTCIIGMNGGMSFVSSLTGKGVIAHKDYSPNSNALFTSENPL